MLNNIQSVSFKCVTMDHFISLKHAFEDKSIYPKLQPLGYGDLFEDNFLNKIKVIEDPKKIEAYMILYDDSIKNETNLLDLIFTLFEKPEPIKNYYDPEVDDILDEDSEENKDLEDLEDDDFLEKLQEMDTEKILSNYGSILNSLKEFKKDCDDDSPEEEEFESSED